MTEVPESLKAALRQRVKEVRQQIIGHDTPLYEVTRNRICDSVSNEFAVQLDAEGYTVKSPVAAMVAGRKHFVAVVTETPQQPSLETQIIVDGTLQQFGEDYPEELVESIDEPIITDIYDYIDIDS